MTTFHIDLRHPSAAKKAHTNKKKLLIPITQS
jgi:hypothetical protein